MFKRSVEISQMFDFVNDMPDMLRELGVEVVYDGEG